MCPEDFVLSASLASYHAQNWLSDGVMVLHGLSHSLFENEWMKINVPFI